MKHTDAAMRFIRDSIATRGYPPSRRELGEHLGLANPSQAQVVVDSLVRDGLIQVDRNVMRGIRIVGTVGKAATEEMT